MRPERSDRRVVSSELGKVPYYCPCDAGEKSCGLHRLVSSSRVGRGQERAPPGRAGVESLALMQGRLGRNSVGSCLSLSPSGILNAAERPQPS